MPARLLTKPPLKPGFLPAPSGRQRKTLTGASPQSASARHGTMPSKNEVAKSKWQAPDTLPLRHFDPQPTAPCATAWGLSHGKEQLMNNETSTPATASPLTAKPNLVKKSAVRPLTFISTSAKPVRRPLQTKLCALFRTTAAVKPLKNKILFSYSLLTKAQRGNLKIRLPRWCITAFQRENRHRWQKYAILGLCFNLYYNIMILRHGEVFSCKKSRNDCAICERA